MRKPALLAVALVALLAMGGVALFGGRGGSKRTESQATPAAVDDASSVDLAPVEPRTRRPDEPINVVAQDVLVAPSIYDALSLHAARRGGEDRQVRSLYLEARDACWNQVVAALRRQRRPQTVADPLRDWATEELQRRCEGFPETIPSIDATLVPSLYDIDTMQGKDAAIAQAFELLRTADNAVDLIDAGETLLANDRFPMRELFGTQDPGYDALAQALRHAALWRECEVAGRCGADSFATLAFCVEAGCRRGATLPQALREALPARDFALVVRLRAWYAAQRRG